MPRQVPQLEAPSLTHSPVMYCTDELMDHAGKASCGQQLPLFRNDKSVNICCSMRVMATFSDVDLLLYCSGTHCNNCALQNEQASDILTPAYSFARCQLPIPGMQLLFLHLRDGLAVVYDENCTYEGHKTPISTYSVNVSGRPEAGVILIHQDGPYYLTCKCTLSVD